MQRDPRCEKKYFYVYKVHDSRMFFSISTLMNNFFFFQIIFSTLILFHAENNLNRRLTIIIENINEHFVFKVRLQKK